MVMVPEVAVMLAVFPTTELVAAETTPALVTVATLVLSEVQVTELVTLAVVLSA